jgi:hypothetical protein
VFTAVIAPKLADVNVPVGFANCVWLNTLSLSMRICSQRTLFAESVKFFAMMTFSC